MGVSCLAKNNRVVSHLVTNDRVISFVVTKHTVVCNSADELINNKVNLHIFASARLRN